MITFKAPALLITLQIGTSPMKAPVKAPYLMQGVAGAMKVIPKYAGIRNWMESKTFWDFKTYLNLSSTTSDRI